MTIKYRCTYECKNESAVPEREYEVVVISDTSCKPTFTAPPNLIPSGVGNKCT